MIGVPRGKVKISPHNPKWIRSFEAEKKLLKKFGRIEHIGSTSIPGLCAKPIIDIAIGVSSLKNKGVAKYKKPLAEIDYQYIREKRPGEFLFIKGPESNRTHHLHMIELDSPAWNKYISFRDYLINNPDSIKEYADLKTKLATKFAEDRKSYTAGKSKLIEKFIKKYHDA